MYYIQIMGATVAQIPTSLSGLVELRDQQLAAILGLLADQSGQSLIESYKASCVKRRILSRIRRSGCQSPEQYLERLAADPDEGARLLGSLSIHVSQFFRNQSLFDALQTKLLPQLVQRSAGQLVRLWSVGCSAGQEPYSLAMLLSESFDSDKNSGRFEILATDIDNRMLTLASAGCYEEQALQGISAERRERFFIPSGQGFRLCPQLRGLVSFRQMDLLQFAQYQPADLILCRNTLIYFNRPAQEKILHTFADILPQDGILVLGKSESMPNQLRSRFATLDPVERIYSRR
jgi:chemotaxis protein methyltransferase CheR